MKRSLCLLSAVMAGSLLAGCQSAGAVKESDLVGKWRWDWAATESAKATHDEVVRASRAAGGLGANEGFEGEVLLSAGGKGHYMNSTLPIAWTIKGDAVVLDPSGSPVYQSVKGAPPLIHLAISPDRKTLTEKRPPAGPNGQEIVNVFRKG